MVARIANLEEFTSGVIGSIPPEINLEKEL